MNTTQFEPAANNMDLSFNGEEHSNFRILGVGKPSAGQTKRREARAAKRASKKQNKADCGRKPLLPSKLKAWNDCVGQVAADAKSDAADAAADAASAAADNAAAAADISQKDADNAATIIASPTSTPVQIAAAKQTIAKSVKASTVATKAAADAKVAADVSDVKAADAPDATPADKDAAKVAADALKSSGASTDDKIAGMPKNVAYGVFAGVALLVIIGGIMMFKHKGGGASVAAVGA
jgi:hypothetical protein